ncbi:Zinc finger, C2CH-type,Kelch repeat type 1 [Cinara cedri]|uniref:Zinc finger, C2CH-type,Kelch repeat type 1 n=1 Tax=Cinara cedri TaxID=506608 RepID=A0A5E4N8T6_9HEMI|nr:Zinc finger, C2CH-type,Kelch repeat type 1 [Cinara cedri]
MVKTCSVPLCEGVASKQCNIKLFKFPTSIKLQKKWLKSITLHYPNFKLGDSSFMCSKHFVKMDFIKSTRAKTFFLRANAVPSMFNIEKRVNIFNDCEEHDTSDTRIGFPIKVEEITLTKMSGSLDVPGPSHIVVDQVSSTNLSLDISELSRIGNVPNMTASNQTKRTKCLFGDFKFDDLNNPRKRKQFWNVSQKTINNFRQKTKSLHDQNVLLKKRVTDLTLIINHLKDESNTYDAYISILKVSGFGGKNHLNNARVFDCSAQEWRMNTSMSIGKSNFGVGVLDNLI